MLSVFLYLLTWLVIIYITSVIVVIVLSSLYYRVDKAMSYNEKLEHLTYKKGHEIANLSVLFVPLFNLQFIFIYLFMIFKIIITNSKIKLFLIRLILGKTND